MIALSPTNLITIPKQMITQTNFYSYFDDLTVNMLNGLYSMDKLNGMITLPLHISH